MCNAQSDLWTWINQSFVVLLKVDWNASDVSGLICREWTVKDLEYKCSVAVSIYSSKRLTFDRVPPGPRDFWGAEPSRIGYEATIMLDDIRNAWQAEW